MPRLCESTLQQLPANIEKPRYARSSVSAGIVHLGAGNFHRAHQAVYCDTLLNNGETKWGITAVSLRSPKVRDSLAPQDLLYTQATLSKATSYRVIGAIKNLLVGPESPTTVINALSNSSTQVVTTTITEKGYCLNNGEIDRQHSDIIHDLDSLAAPKTAYGYLAAALIKRSTEVNSPLTVLCCDNLHGGGAHLQAGVEMLLQAHKPNTLPWVSIHVAFSSSMVDRVTPATDKRIRDKIATQLGVYDAAPVTAEPFTQWIIEDKFAGKRPPFDRAGAIFVTDITPYEQIKLRFLNAGHSMLAALGYLAGDQFIHEALNRPTLSRFTEQALKRNVMPVTVAAEGVNCADYIDQVLERFRNSNLPYATLQVGTDSSQKIQQRWLPSIDDALNQGRDASYLAFALAAWVKFIRQALLSNDLNDPLHSEFSNCKTTDGESDVQQFLNLAGAGNFGFSTNKPFIARIEVFHAAIEIHGVETALSRFLSKNP